MAMLRLRREGLAWSEVGGETVILDLSTSVYFAAKGSGSFLITCLADGATEESLAEELVSRFEVDIETARADVADFVNDLESRQMLEHVDEAPTS